MSILCVGQVVYDITLPVDTAIVENQKYRIYNRLTCMGGPAGNAAFLCGTWNIDTSLIARIGNDGFGKEILETLQKANVSTSGVYINPTGPTSISCIISNMNNGNRTIFNTPLSETSFPVQFPKQNPKVILFDGHEKDISLEIIKKYPDALLILDAGTYKEEITKIIRAVHYLVCSQDFAYQYTHMHLDINDKQTWTDTFKKLEELNSNTIVITLGEQGVLYKENSVIYHIPAFCANTVDTTGAGDIFHGAFAYAIHEGYSLKNSILLASLTASISVETLGGQPSIPDFPAVKEKAMQLNQNWIK